MKPSGPDPSWPLQGHPHTPLFPSLSPSFFQFLKDIPSCLPTTTLLDPFWYVVSLHGSCHVYHVVICLVVFPFMCGLHTQAPVSVLFTILSTISFRTPSTPSLSIKFLYEWMQNKNKPLLYLFVLLHLCTSSDSLRDYWDERKSQYWAIRLVRRLSLDNMVNSTQLPPGGRGVSPSQIQLFNLFCLFLMFYNSHLGLGRKLWSSGNNSHYLETSARYFSTILLNVFILFRHNSILILFSMEISPFKA